MSDTVGPARPPDVVLNAFLQMAEDGLEIAITLYVHGSVIAGMLTDVATFLRVMTATLPHAGGEPAFIAALHHVLMEMLDAVDTQSLTDDTVATDSRPMPDFVQLHTAVTVQPDGTTVPIKNGLWRGRVAAIDAWYLGFP